MVKHTETIRQLISTNRLSVFDQFVGLTTKGFKIFWKFLGKYLFE